MAARSARLPGQKAGSVPAEIAEPIDLMPTVLETFEVSYPQSVTGESPVPLLPKCTEAWRREAKPTDLA